MGSYGMCGVHGGVMLGDEAVARGVNMGKRGPSGSGGWDGGVQDSRSAPFAKGFSACESYVSPENLHIVRFPVDRTIPHQ